MIGKPSELRQKGLNAMGDFIEGLKDDLKWILRHGGGESRAKGAGMLQEGLGNCPERSNGKTRQECYTHTSQTPVNTTTF